MSRHIYLWCNFHVELKNLNWQSSAAQSEIKKTRFKILHRLIRTCEVFDREHRRFGCAHIAFALWTAKIESFEHFDLKASSFWL